MRYLVDTSVLVRAVHAGDPRRLVAVNAVRSLSFAGHDLCILPQNVAEFWAVCTRPAGPPSNGLGMSAHSTRRLIQRFGPIFDMLYETPDVYYEWRRLLDEHDISGRQIHDVRLVAATVVHGLDEVVTFDVTHFRRYSGIDVVHPADIAAS